MNYSDAERINTVLQTNNWQETKNLAEADLCLLVTCSVKKKAEDRVFGEIHNLAKWKAKKPGRKVGITGCMIRQTSNQNSEKKDTLLNKNENIDFVWRIEDTAQLPQLVSNEQLLPAEKLENYFSISPENKNKFSVFIPIMTGCDNFCSYCIVPYARGREKSRPKKEVLAECEKAVQQGAKEITLLGQNVDSYQKKAGSFSKLLEKVAQIPELKRLRFSSSHPKDFDESVIEVMAKYYNIENHLHLPAQHGDNAILKKMNRNYTAEEFLEKLTKFRKQLPTASVTTDLIVGFPGETEEQFENLLNFYRQANFDFAFFSKYSARPGTEAAKLPDDITPEIKSKRWHKVNELLKKTTRKKYEEQKGKSLEVLVEGCKENVCFGRSSEYYLVKFPGDKKLIEEFVDVKITEARDVEMWGK